MESQTQTQNEIRGPRKCSFCREPGHTLGKCNSQIAQDLHARFMQKIQNITANTNLDTNAKKAGVLSWHLHGISANECKHLAIKYYQFRGTTGFAALEHILNRVFEMPIPNRNRVVPTARTRAIRALSHQAYTMQSESNTLHRFTRYRERLYRDLENLNQTIAENSSRINEYTNRMNDTVELRLTILRNSLPNLGEAGQNLLNQMETGLTLAEGTQRNAILLRTMRDFNIILTSITSKHSLVTTMFQSEAQAQDLQESRDCPICMSDDTKMINMVTTNCNHEFCRTCICRHIDGTSSSRKPTCPMCRTDLISLEIKDASIYTEMQEKYNNV